MTREYIYTAYSEEQDLTFIMQENTMSGKLLSVEVVGFYYGRPDEQATKQYIGKLEATFE